MYNLTNSTPGQFPGQAGMSNSSTQPQGLFNNAGSPIGRFGQGVQSFADRIGGASGKAQDVLQKLFGNLFGADGSFGQMNGAPPHPEGLPSPDSLPTGAQGPLLGPDATGMPNFGGPLPGPLDGAPGPRPFPGQGAPVQGGFPGQGQGGGFLSRFMPGGQ
jgi:hypothetical protein